MTCSIAVAGAGADWLRGLHRGIEVVGLVPDAADFLAESRAVAVPAVAGRGVQVKTLDAIASGLPVVATSTAVRGLSGLPASVTVADDPDAFAENLVTAVRHRATADLRDDAVRWSHERRRRFEASIAQGTRQAVESNRSEPRATREAATTR